MTWIATLDNGETRIEQKPVPGGRTSWQKLLKFCDEKNINITSLQLDVNEHIITSMPKKMCDGYFQAYEHIQTFYGEKMKDRQGIGSIVGDHVYITWVDLIPSKNGKFYINHEIRKLSEVKIHTTANRGKNAISNKDDSG